MRQNEKHKILVVSHCFLNEATKLRNQNEITQAEERVSKRSFLKNVLANDVELIQLPCPEVVIYGTNRWGHAASQFDTPFYRQEARKMLLPIVLQLEEYAKYPNRFELLGILGIDGSPSCGVNFTYDGDWGGELNGNCNLDATLSTLKKVTKPGIFMAVFKELLLEKHLPMNCYSLETYPHKTATASYAFLDIPKGDIRHTKQPAVQPKSRFALKKESLKTESLKTGKGLDLI